MKKDYFEIKEESNCLNLEEQDDANKGDAKQDDAKKSNNMALGMCFGAMAGSIGMLVFAMFDQLVWGSCVLSLGIVFGMLVGMKLPKK